MIDVFDLPVKALNKQVFYCNSTSGNTTAWQVWQKPQGAKFAHFFVLGGGAGGGGGVAGGTGTARRGGGSGGSSAHVCALFSTNQLPDNLYVQVGSGGAGGIGLATSTNGSAGSFSYVSLLPDSAYTPINIILKSGSVAPTGGVSGGNGGTAGAAGTAWGGSIFNNLGLMTLASGWAGIAGQTTTVPVNTFLSGITSGGGVGAGTNGATWQQGGSIIGGGFVGTISGGTNTGLTGNSGFAPTLVSSYSNSNRLPFLFTGGAGGASSNATAGGNGGNGSFGCGGGGGGAGFTSLAGNGGNGGNGLVIITSW